MKIVGSLREIIIHLELFCYLLDEPRITSIPRIRFLNTQDIQLCSLDE